MNGTMLYTQLAMIGVIALILHVLPRLSRSEIYFAVTVPASFRETPEARRILHRYQLQIWLHSIVAVVLILVAWNSQRPGLASFGIAWLLFGFVLALLVSRRAVGPHAVAPDSSRVAEIAPRSGGLPGGWLGQLAPFLLLGLIGLLLYIYWDALPERWPVRFGIDGQPEAWVARTPGAVLGSLAAIGASCALILVLASGILWRSRRIAVTGAAAAGERSFQRAVLWLLLGSEFVIVLLAGARPLRWLWSDPADLGIAAWLPVFVPPLLILAVLLVFSRIGQGGSRLGPGPVRERPVGDRTRDDCWKLGLFYVNRDDPAVFVEKRFGIGYTVNFGNVRVWVGLAVIVAFPMLMAFLRGS